MTTESRQLISASEIRGLEIRCKNEKCGVRTFIPAGYRGPLAGRCTHCGSMWFEENGERARAIRNLMSSVETLSTEETEKEVSILVEISPVTP